jgi:hypothetical protein
MMQRTILACAALCVIVLVPAQRATAQDIDMRNGTWRGWLMQTDQDSIPVTYAVSHWDKHLLITLRGRSGIMYDMSDAKVKNDVLTFDWAMGAGNALYCRLTRRDGRSFEGTCNDRTPGPMGKGLRVWMLMNPPGRDSTRATSPRPDGSSSRSR